MPSYTKNMSNEVCSAGKFLEPNSENYLDLSFVASPCEKIIFVSDENCITFAIRKLMLDMASLGSAEEAQLQISLHSLIVH